MRNRVQVSLLAAVAVGLMLGGMAVGQSTDGGVIYACSNNLRGELRIVPQGRDCDENETAQSWSIQGPEGPVGPAGPPGLQGPPGPPAGYEFETPTTSLSEWAQGREIPKPPKRGELPEYPGKSKPDVKPLPVLGGEPTRVFSARTKHRIAVPVEDFGTVGRLVLLPGKYAVTARVFTGPDLVWTCNLESSDGSHDWVDFVGGLPTRGTVVLMLDVATTFKPIAIEMWCRPWSSTADAPDHGVVDSAYIRAVNVASVSQTTFVP